MEFHYRWEYDLKASPEKLWPFVSDTNRFNRDTSVPALEVQPDKQRLRNARRRAQLTLFGLPVQWEEQPFEWVRPSRFGVSRAYSKGPIAELRALGVLSETSEGGTHFIYEIWAKPKNWLGYLAIPLQIGFASSRKFRNAFKKYDQMAGAQLVAIAEPLPAAAVSDAMVSRLASVATRLKSDGADPQVVDRLVEFVQQADDFALMRIKPYQLADEWGEPRRTLLETCLLATRAGLLDLQWDLLCPLCRGSQGGAGSLAEIHSAAHCDTCRIDFTVNFDRFVELTFRPNDSIRRLDVRDYCIGSPQRTPHVVAQQLLPSRTSRVLDLPLEVGNYRLRALELSGDLSVRVSNEGANTALVTVEERGWPAEELTIAPRTSLELRNETDTEHLFILERLAWSDQAATAAEVTALQVFRDLFSTEAIRRGEQFSVGTLTVLFTDLKSSTQLYREIGDATAFGRVMNHFDVLKGVIAEQDGAIVKTIGDAVMAVFRRPASALEAMLSAQVMLASPPQGVAPLTLKAGMHSGPCIAVTLNDRLDYFGSTVNMAARLESLSTGNDVIISRALYDDPEVRELLDSEGFEAVPFQHELKGFAEEQFELWRVSPAAKKAPTDLHR